MEIYGPLVSVHFARQSVSSLGQVAATEVTATVSSHNTPGALAPLGVVETDTDVLPISAIDFTKQKLPPKYSGPTPAPLKVFNG